ncbi:MAG: C1 family peptidase, partial [Bacteroidales bacterium]|nr:C1 family peptidase [Bacteroidales bacterium]
MSVKVRNLMLASALCLVMTPATAQKNHGGISSDMMRTISAGFGNNPTDKALSNILAGNSPSKMAINHRNNTFDTHFSNQVNQKAVTNQKSSGRCWMFSGLNVLRNKAIRVHNLPQDFQFSQTYLFFYDQLEKSNLFLQAVIDTRAKSFDDKEVEWLFRNPISDGGQFTGVANLVSKYGLVPADVMPETYNADNTSSINSLLALKLREDGLLLREAAARKGTTMESLTAQKTEMLATVYRMLAMVYGVPPASFTWTERDAQGKAVSTETYTPMSFYKKYAATDFSHFCMIMNDPTREYHKVYEIQYDRHVYDGDNWRYLNLPMEEIAPICIASIKDSSMMYFSCDVGKFLDADRGYLDPENYDYESLFGTTFGMNKEQRVRTFVFLTGHLARSLANASLS